MTDLPAENALLDAWQTTLRRKGGEPALLAADGGVLQTFTGIEADAQAWEPNLDGLAAHAVVAVQIGNSEHWPAVLLALWRRRLIPLPLGEMHAAERTATLEFCQASGLIALEHGRPVLHLHAAPVGRPDWRGPAPQFLKLTSGTTRGPRGVRFQAHQLIADCRNICASMGISESDINYGVIPFSHSYGFSNLLTPLLVEGVRLVVSNDRLPRAILGGIVTSGATVLPATPFFFQKFSDFENAPAIGALRLCISAGAPLAAVVGSAFSARYGLKVHTFYGSSECGGIAYDTSDDLAYQDGFVGQPMSGVTIEHESDDIGPITVKGPAVGDSYFPEDTDRTLSDGAFIPSDLVRFSEQGLFIAGRTSEVINVAGRKLNPLEVEARLVEFPGVKQAVVFGVASLARGEVPVACVAGHGLAREAVLQFCHETLSAWQVPKDVWVVGEIPFNERGKISRRALAESYSAQHHKTR